MLDSVTPIDFKVFSKDTKREISVMLSSNNLKATRPPIHIHPNFDEVLQVTKGELKFKVGEEIFFLKVGDTVFIPETFHMALL